MELDGKWKDGSSRMDRFSLKALFILISVSALFAVALASPSPLWAKTAYTMTAFVLLLFTWLVLLVGRSSFLLGFVVLGWGYGLLALSPGASENGSGLLTDLALARAYPAVHDDSDLLGANLSEAEQLGARIVVQSDGSLSWTSDAIEQRRESFMRIGHCILTLIFGTVGGAAGLWITKRDVRLRGRKTTPPDS